jgi:hypothetical protein
MLIISVNMKYEKSRKEVAMFTAILFEKQRIQDELLLLNIRVKHSRMPRIKKYTLFVPEVSSLKAPKQ